jgi:hypothetical protein
VEQDERRAHKAGDGIAGNNAEQRRTSPLERRTNAFSPPIAFQRINFSALDTRSGQN